MRQDKEERSHVMAEAILAGEQVEEFSLVEQFAVVAFVFAELSWLFEDLLVRNRPRDAGDSETKQKEEAELMRQRLVQNARVHVYVTPDRIAALSAPIIPGREKALPD